MCVLVLLVFLRDQLVCVLVLSEEIRDTSATENVRFWFVSDVSGKNLVMVVVAGSQGTSFNW